MNIFKNISERAVVAAFAFALLLSLGGSALAQGGMGAMTAEKKVDKRKLTTIQTASVDVGGMKNAVEVRYLNLPWGRTTFGYIENGSDSANKNYYAAILR